MQSIAEKKTMKPMHNNFYVMWLNIRWNCSIRKLRLKVLIEKKNSISLKFMKLPFRLMSALLVTWHHFRTARWVVWGCFDFEYFFFALNEINFGKIWHHFYKNKIRLLNSLFFTIRRWFVKFKFSISTNNTQSSINNFCVNLMSKRWI